MTTRRGEREISRAKTPCMNQTGVGQYRGEGTKRFVGGVLNYNFCGRLSVGTKMADIYDL